MENVWHLLSEPRVPGHDDYFEHARTDLIDMLTAPPKRFLDVGCGSGTTGAEVKRRYPGAIVDGIEYSPAAGALAQAQLDRVVIGDAGAVDFAALYELASIDAVLLADILEHLYDPWRFLARLRPYVTPDAQIIASIPNVRNLALLTDLIAKGTFPYDEAGLLDVTHIRFFTRSDIIKMFDATGYRVLTVDNIRDPRLAPIAVSEFPVSLDLPNFTLRDIDADTFAQLSTIQFYLRVRPHTGAT